MADFNIVERAAKAHWDAKRYSTSRAWDELKPEERTKAMRHIRSTLQAIREPNEVMLDAAMDAWDRDGRVELYGPGMDDYRGTWQIMIDAAIGEEDQ